MTFEPRKSCGKPANMSVRIMSSNLTAPARALRIVSERSTKDVTRDLLLEDLASKDRGRRNKALTAMYFLVSNRSRTSGFTIYSLSFLISLG